MTRGMFHGEARVLEECLRGNEEGSVEAGLCADLHVYNPIIPESSRSGIQSGHVNATALSFCCIDVYI